MGLFSRNTPGDPRYVCPKASNRDYYRYERVSRNEYPMMNFAFLEKTMQQGLALDALPTAIFDSLAWEPDIDVSSASQALTEELFRRTPDISFSEEANEAYLVDIHFGILAGIFERRSGQFKQGQRHPAIWNALSFYSQSHDESPGGLREEEVALRIATPHLGYTQGIEHNSPVGALFSRWSG
jgi:hypothetical protein